MADDQPGQGWPGSANTPWQPVDVVPAPGRRRAPRGSPSKGLVASLSAIALVVVGAGGYVVVHHHSKPTPAAAAPASHRATPSKKPRAAGSASASSASPSPATSPSASASPTSGATVTPTGWVNGSVHPVTAPVAIGNVVVVYTADTGQLTLRAIDPASGAVLWEHPATTAQSTPGQPFSVTSQDTTVFYYVSVGDPTMGTAEISAVDATTGKPKWTTSQAVSYADMPSLCSDKTALCDSAYTSATESQEIRTDLATGTQSLLSSSASRNLGTGIWDAGDRAPEHIEHVNEVTGRVVWKDNVAQLFEQSVSSDNGWDFSTFGDVYVGWLGTQDKGAADTHTVDLSGQHTVGIRAVDGVRLWRRPGLFGCPVQGINDQAHPFAVRCVVSGTLTLDAAFEGVVSSHLDVTMQGFDVHTGVTIWNDHLGNSPAAVGFGSDTIVRISGDVFSLTDFLGKTTAINLRTGAMSTPSSDTVGWCLQDGTFNVTGINQDDGTPLPFATNGLTSPCTPNGATATPADGTATGYGATVGGDFVWSSKDGLHAFAIAKGG